jgi:hypothetical protein
MKHRGNLSSAMLMLALAITTLLPLAVAQGAKIRMPDFSGLAEKAKESVDISLEGDQLKSAGSFLGGGASDPKLAELIKGLDGIFIKVFEFEKAGEYSTRDIDTMVRQVESEGWKKLMAVRSGDERVEMWLRDNHRDGGMFLVVSEPKELVMINIVGNVNLQALSQLQGKFGLPNLPGIAPPAPAASPPAAPSAR